MSAKSKTLPIPSKAEIKIASRDQISNYASDLQSHAKHQAELSQTAYRKKEWSSLEGRCRVLSNDCCEPQHKIITLRKRLRELYQEQSSLP